MARTTCLPPRASLVILESIIPTASTRRPPQPRSTRPSPPLVLRAAATAQRAGRGNERTADPRRSRIERHAAHARGGESGGREGVLRRWRRAGRCCGYAHDEALTSTGSPRTRHRSASASRALCINPRNPQLCPETRRHAAVTRPFWCRPSHLTGGRQRLPSWALICAPLEVTRYERGVRLYARRGRPAPAAGARPA